MTIEYRPIAPDELLAWLEAEERSFSGAPREDDVRRARTIAEPDRNWAALDDGAIVGTNGAYTMPMTVPGGEVTVGFVTGVGVAATHRRRGINTELMRRQLDDAHARGEAVSVLFASEGGIYGRFGYEVGVFDLTIDVRNDRTGFIRGIEPSGEVRFVTADVAIPAALAVHDEVRRDRPGMVALDDARFRYITQHDHGPEKELPLFSALHEGAEGVDGFALYKVKHEWRDSTPASELQVRELQATNPGAYADLWRFVFDVDLIERTVAWGRPVDEPLLHLLREPRRLRARVGDALWVRLVDVAAALAARRYRTSGRAVLEVEDRFCPWNDGRYALETASDGTATVEPTDAEPDVTCTANDLAAVYLGGASMRQLRRASRVRELTGGALERLDAMLAWDPSPWAPYDF
jgi:predicted acetyltransferase